jgi:hypothetical protein
MHESRSLESPQNPSGPSLFAGSAGTIHGGLPVGTAPADTLLTFVIGRTTRQSCKIPLNPIPEFQEV